MQHPALHGRIGSRSIWRTCVVQRALAAVWRESCGRTPVPDWAARRALSSRVGMPNQGAA